MCVLRYSICSYRVIDITAHKYVLKIPLLSKHIAIGLYSGETYFAELFVPIIRRALTGIFVNLWNIDLKGLQLWA